MLAEYLQVLSQIEMLSPKEEQRLWREYKEEKNIEARQILIEKYQPLVLKEALRWDFQESTLMDLVQEGTVGLMEAADRYEWRRGVAFSLYARHRIRGRMLDYVYKNGTDIPVPDSAWEESRNFFNRLTQPETDAFEEADRNLLWENIREAVLRLPDKEQLVVEGIYLDEKAPKEMAEALSVSTTYVYKLQKKGIRRLRGMLSRLIHERRQ